MRFTRCHLSAVITAIIFVVAIALAPEAKSACPSSNTVTSAEAVG